MSRIARVLALALCGALLAVLPTGTAQAAAKHPWGAYFPSVGIVCIYVDGSGDRSKATVLSKSATQVKLRRAGRTQTFRLLSGGRMRLVQQSSADGTRIISDELVPSPKQLLAGQAGKSVLTMKVTMSRSFARQYLKQGRLLTLIYTYRLSGVAPRDVALADAAGTKVTAFGVKQRLRTFDFRNVKRKYHRQVRRELRSLGADMNGTNWVSEGRWSVRTVYGDDVTRQVSCG